MRLVKTSFGVRDEHAPTFGRQNLTLWSGSFSSTFEGWARELPNHDGFMVTLEYGDPRSMRVACESPRTDRNYVSVDAALVGAIAALEAQANERAS